MIKTKEMKNIDCEVYVSQLINFFEKNPNDLMILIGDLQKEGLTVKQGKSSMDNFKRLIQERNGSVVDVEEAAKLFETHL